MFRRQHLLVAACAASIALAACGAGSREGDLEPRYVAVHNALAAMGLAQVGPLHEGSLPEGREERVAVQLKAQCTTVVAVGGRGVHDLDVALLDPSGAPVAHDVSREPQATLRACVESDGNYTLVVKMTRGAGDYLLATWAGGASELPSTAPVSSSAAAAVAQGTCESPIPIAAGNYNGTTSRGESNNEGSCANSGAREVVYKLDLSQRQRVVVDVNPRFDSVVYVRKDECGEPDAEVACNDDAPNQHRSKIDAVLDSGTYYVFVDGYANEGGAFSMHVTVSDVPSLAEVCRQAHPLPIGAALSGTMSGAFDRVGANGCGQGAKGPDVTYKLSLDRRSRVRIAEASNDFTPVLHLRRQCTDEGSEFACSDSGAAEHEAAYVGVLDQGSYTVFVDAAEHDADGRYTLMAEAAPERGSGTQGDGCADAVPVTRSEPTLPGDTFLARDDVAGRCGGAGAGDVVYRLELARRSRVTARLEPQEGEHVLSLMRTCADRATELACERTLDQVLAAGTYFLAVDGATPAGAGKFVLRLFLRDAGAQEAACKSPPVLVDGQVLRATTAGGTDKFTTSCGGREDAQSS